MKERWKRDCSYLVVRLENINSISIALDQIWAEELFKEFAITQSYFLQFFVLVLKATQCHISIFVLSQFK